MQKKNFLYFILLILFNSNTIHSKKINDDVVFYKKGNALPVFLITNTKSKQQHHSAKIFINYFKKLTGKELEIKPNKDALEKLFTIKTKLLEKDDKGKEDFFSLNFIEGKKLIIKGNSHLAIRFGIAHFFQKYTTLNDPLNHKKQELIMVPYHSIDMQNPTFEYREPYFYPNMDYANSLWNKTNQLENKWALWGHNLEKVIPKETRSNSMYAKINGTINKTQMCFSSSHVSTFLSQFIKNKLEENSEINFFNISPLDNNIVCQCDKCIALGNTTKNSSPSVFTLINKLAKKFPNAYFFSNAYLSTKKPPTFNLEKNTGVLISTINYSNAVPFKNLKNEKRLSKLISSWKKVTPKIYIWDYAVNFDNYLDFYPTLKISQENLNYFNEKGVNGLFMHGSEYDYSTFDHLKHTIYSKLLWNPKINIDQEIESYFETYLPTISNYLTEFYIFSENEALKNPKKQSIYSGIEAATKKYLNIPKFNTLYNSILSKQNLIQDFEQEKYNKLMLSLTYIKLEIMRTHPFENYGYATFIDPTNYRINDNLKPVITNLKLFSKLTKINILDELRTTIPDYINQWETIILKAPKKNIFLNKPFKITTALDEDYQNIKILNNGCYGFKKYNTNWFINSTPLINISIDKKHIENPNMLFINFLNDKRHKILLPQKIEILADGKVIKTKKITPNKSLIKSINTINIPLSITGNVSQIEIRITNIKKKNSIAIDEIIIQ